MIDPDVSMFDPADYVRGFTRQQVTDHLIESLVTFERIATLHPIPDDLREPVFHVVQTMTAAMQKKDASVSPVTKPSLVRPL